MDFSVFSPFDTSGFLPRWRCGNWSEALGWLHIISDLLIWSAYLAIPLVLVFFVRRRKDIPFPRLFWLFGAFIVSCGTTHLLSAIIFYHPVYRLDGLVKLITAVVSWATVLALVPIIPQALAMQSPAQLERVVAERTQELAEANEELRTEIEHRSRMEEILAEERERFQLILSSIGDGVIAADLMGRVTFINDVACQLTGWVPGEALGSTLAEVLSLINEGNRLPSENPAMRSLREGTIVARANSTLLCARNGAVRPIDHSAAPIRGRGKVVGAVVVFRDVSEQKRAEESLRLRDRVIQAVNQGIFISDATRPEQPIIYANSGFERLTGYTQQETLGRNCRFLVGPETDAQTSARLQQALDGGHECSVEILNYRKDGMAFWNAVSITPIRSQEGKLTHFVGVQVDITERRKLEEQFRQASKMEAMGRLAGGVAHDFNNLLTVINGCSELLLAGRDAGDPLRNPLEMIRDAGDRAASLTRQLLAFSRRAVLEPRVLDLNAVVLETKKLLVRLIGEDVQLITKLDPGISRVRVDSGHFGQVLLNLAVNARDAMPTGGKLTIETLDVVIQEGTVPGRLEIPPGRYVVTTVTDTGCGMTDSVKTHLFEPFFTTKDTGQGTGLGLATVYGIIKQSGGHTEVQSEVGVGTTVHVFLPAVATTHNTASGSQQHAVRGHERVLLVEDQDDVRRLGSLALVAHGYSVIAAASGAEALRLVERDRPELDVVLTDVVMPGMSGRQLAEALRPLYPRLKVLYMSGYMDDAVLRHGVMEATDNFLQKPFTPSSLARRVREVLDGGKKE